MAHTLSARNLFRRGLPVLALGLFLGCGSSTTGSAPTLTSFSPAYGTVGSTVYVVGSGFSSGINSVTVGGIAAASGTIASDTSLNFPVPDAAVTGVIVVNTPNGSASSVTEFIVQPSGFALSTNTGSASQGTQVTITGYGMLGFTGVQFGTVSAAITAQTANELVFNVPAGAPIGQGQITLVINPSYTAVNAVLSDQLIPFDVTQ